MEYVRLGRTGLMVSVAGLGCGGFSRLGLGTGKSEAEAVALVHQALDLGINLLDTAAVYGTGRRRWSGDQDRTARQCRNRDQGVDPTARGPFRRRARGGEPRQFAQAARHRLC
jgi:predicted oxidoreductase